MGPGAPTSHVSMRPRVGGGAAEGAVGVDRRRRDREGIKGKWGGQIGNRGSYPKWEGEQAILGAWGGHAWVLFEFIQALQFGVERREAAEDYSDGEVAD